MSYMQNSHCKLFFEKTWTNTVINVLFRGLTLITTTIIKEVRNSVL